MLKRIVIQHEVRKLIYEKGKNLQKKYIEINNSRKMQIFNILKLEKCHISNNNSWKNANFIVKPN